MYSIYNIDEIKKRYQDFSDTKIKRIALNESKQLTPDVREILKKEIQKRNLNDNLIAWIEAENNTFTDFEKQSLIRKIEHLTCPNCNKKRSTLIAWEFTTIVSIIVWHEKTSQNKILCKHCSNSQKIKSFLITGLAGWWSKSGLFFTPYALIKGLINMLFYQRKIHDRIITDFIEQNNGNIRLYGTNDENLFQLISKYNNVKGR